VCGEGVGAPDVEASACMKTLRVACTKCHTRHKAA
jgi:hypothetical protein